jgi:hypothetical protein
MRMSSSAAVVRPMINPIGWIDEVCAKCGISSLARVYAGPPEDYPHGAEVVCNCGNRRKAKLFEIATAQTNEDGDSGWDNNQIVRDAEVRQLDRIRAELIDWLAPIRPNEALRGRRITDEIDRICPKE